MIITPTASVSQEGIFEWHLDGVLHRVDGPACLHPDGYEEWYLNGELHREGGPAIWFPDGFSAWYKHDERHRTDGPAVEWATGKEWWIEGTYYMLHEWLRNVDISDTKKAEIILKYG